MDKYQVYLTNGDVINIEADNFSTNYDHGAVRFIKGDFNIAVFVLSNICGFKEVNEFDEEDDE